MDWPAATVILGALATLAVGIMKAVPQRMVVEDAKGQRCATTEDVHKLTAAVEKLVEYVHNRNHDIIGAVDRGQANVLLQTVPKLESVLTSLTTLLERTRRGGIHDED